MKTSGIEVHDMQSVLSAIGVEKRIGEVPVVEALESITPRPPLARAVTPRGHTGALRSPSVTAVHPASAETGNHDN